jgi:peptidyl-prolyl cis-trans isomerase SurA
MKSNIKILIIMLTLLCNNSFSAKLVDSVVASINGNPITLLDLKSAMSIILEKDDWDAFSREEKTQILNEVINRKLVLLEAEKIGITAEEREIELSINDVLKNRSITRTELEEKLKKRGVSWSDYTSEISYQILKEKILQRVIFAKIQEDNDTLKNFYLANRSKFKSKESVHLYHIMLPFNGTNINETRKTAEQIYSEIKSGKNFENVAEKYTGKSLSELDLGYIQKGDLLPELDRQVFSTPEGGITRPIKSEKGYHIFYVKKHIDSGIKSFEESMPEVRDLYLKESADKLYNEWLNKLREKYVIKIIDKALY